MSQIKKKYILDGAVDGAKLLLLNDQAIKAKDASGVEQSLMKLDTEGVLKLLKMPQLPSAPTSSMEVSSKGYVDGEVSAEAAARQKADSGLQGQIDTEKGRIDAILLASDADKDSFAEIVSLINSVDTTNDNAFAAYVLSNDAALAQEVSDRESGDSTEAAAREKADNALSGRLDALELDSVTKQYVDTQDGLLSGRLDVIEGDSTVAGSVAKAQADAQAFATSEVVAFRDGLYANDFSAQQTNNASQQKSIDDHESRLDVIEGGAEVEGSITNAKIAALDYTDAQVSAEAAARQKDYDALDDRLDVLEADPVTKTYVDAQDTALQGQIDTEKGRIDAILLASDADKDSFAEIVSLINSVDTTNDNAFAAYVLSNDAALAQEIKDRQAGDNALDVRLDVLEADPTTKAYVDGEITATEQYIDAEISSVEGRLDIIEGGDTVEGSVAKAEKDAKDYADSIMATEQSVRQKADSDLDARLDVLEADPTTASYVDSQVSAEAAARQKADDEIDARIDALEGVSYQKESFTLTGTDISNGYVDLAYEAKPYSTHAFVDRLAAHEGVDYSVSVVSGKTRLTWTGPLASGGASELVSGDKVYVNYSK